MSFKVLYRNLLGISFLIYSFQIEFPGNAFAYAIAFNIPKCESFREYLLQKFISIFHEKKNFTEISKTLARYRFENNFKLSKELCKNLKLLIRNIVKSFNILEISVLYVIILIVQENYFQICV